MRKLIIATAVAAWALGLASATAGEGQQGTQPATRPAAQPLPADQVLSQLLSSRETEARPLQPVGMPETDKTTGAGAVAPGAATMTLIREGTFLVDRVGRLTRGSDGQSWEFAFDADGKAMRDPPVVILPNQKLMLMENQAKTVSRDLRFRITGFITEYRARNYILLEKAVVLTDAGPPAN